VKRHDGKPFTANDVKCTFDKVRDLTPDKFRKNPRKAWFSNVRDITVQGDNEVTFHLERPQPALLALLASGLFADLPVPHLGAGAAHGADRHRAVQVRLVQAERSRSRWRAIRTTGSRGGRISTGSRTPS
jgi:ABC-type transport system substrate-binding protein